jgi:hypothetical protein
MTFPKSILLLIGLTMFAALVACSSSSHHTTPPPVITVSLSAFTGPLAVNSQTPITATTTDTAGVNWSVTCATTGVACGTFSASQTATGVATNYIAPPAPTTNVVITATSVTTSTISASTSPAITINGATLADGTYVFWLAGEDANSNYYVAGQITIAGGLITGGEQDFADVAEDRFDQINPTGSSIAYTSADGNVTITLVTCNGGNCGASDTNIGVLGTETLNGTILPLSTTGRAFITEFDASASASGELEPQDLATGGAATVTPANGYAFVLNGYDPSGLADPLAIGGIINIDDKGGVVGSISGTGSIFDANDAGTTYPGMSFLSTSNVSAPDPLGRVTFTLDATNAVNFPEILLAGYIVDSSHIRLMEIHDTYLGTLGGVAYSQGATNTGTFTAASAAGTYVVGVTGFDTTPGVLQAVNQLTLTAGPPTTVAGFVDYNDLATSSGVTAGVSPDPVTAAGYTVDTAGIGGASAGDITIAGVTDSGANVNYNVQLYLDGNGHALAITMDANDVVAGAGYKQGAGPFAFTGNYALDVTGADGSHETEFDGAGPVTAAAGNILGTVDLNWPANAATYPATAVNGTFVTTGTSAPNGIYTGTITGVDVDSCILVGTCSVDNFSYYLIDAAGDNIAIETDESQLTLGFFLQQ